MSLILMLSFCIADLQAQIVDEAPLDGLYDEEEILQYQPIPYPKIRKADVMWSKRIWREIDFRQKFNQKFYFPIEAQANWKSFITTVLDAMKEGKITAYDISNTDELLVPITYNEVIGRQTDSIYQIMQRPYPPYEEFDTVIYTEFDPTNSGWSVVEPNDAAAGNWEWGDPEGTEYQPAEDYTVNGTKCWITGLSATPSNAPVSSAPRWLIQHTNCRPENLAG